MKKLPLAVLLAIMAGGSLWLYGAHQRSVGRLQATIAARDSTITALQHRKARVDSIYRVDTLRLTRWRTSYDTLRDTVLKHLTDTLKVVEYIHAADSTIAACSAVVLTCSQRVSQRDSIIALQGLQIKALGKRGKLFGLIPLPSRGLSLGLGVVGGYLLGRK